MHREGSSHKYPVSWTTIRDPQLGPDADGNFFVCTHGTKVEAAADTVVVWRPKLWHGTSLQNVISLQEVRKRILELESEETAE